VIVRILEEGQFDVADSTLDDLNALDDALIAAVDGGDEASFSEALAELLNAIKKNGEPVAEDYLGPSDLMLPHAGSTLDEVRALLGEEGLIPG